MARSVTVHRKRRLGNEAAQAERRILRALTIVTAAAPTLEELSLDPATRGTAERVRDVFASPNVVRVGMSEKVTKGKGTGVLALTFYVEKKPSMWSGVRLRSVLLALSTETSTRGTPCGREGG
jgi:hypothetical protein